MKKCYFILGLILATSTAAADTNKNYRKMVKEQAKNVCIELFNEDGPVADQAKMKAFCNKVANCIVDNAPNDYVLQDPTYRESALFQCMANEAKKL